jgi:hypothetical protein
MRIVSTLIVMAGVVSAPAMAQGGKPLEESSANARAQMERFASCVADRSPEKAARTIAMDFRSTTYRSALKNLADANRDCYGYRSTMRSGGLSFAGALAERLLERDATALNARIVRAVSTQTAARSPSDAIALCVVRSAPDDVARLFATEVASDAERDAVKALQVASDACARNQARLETTPEGLRSMLATAAFRTVTTVVAESN